MVEGWVNCPQCDNSICVGPFYHASGTTPDECDDCGCKFSYKFELHLEIEDIVLLEKGTNWDEE
jgi:hypothetical protein